MTDEEAAQAITDDPNLTSQQKIEKLAKLRKRQASAKKAREIGTGLGIGTYSGVNSALFGIPDVIVKAANSDAYKKFKQLRESDKYRGAEMAGNLAGALAPTGGLLFKGAGKALGLGSKIVGGALKGGKLGAGLAKGADVLSDAGKLIKTGEGAKGILGAAGRGALTAAEQSIPRVLGGTQTGEEALGGVALGGAIGGGLGALGKILPAKRLGLTAPQIDESLRDMELAGMGVTGRDVKRALTSGARNQGLAGSARTGSIIKHSDDVKDATLAMAKKFNLQTDDDIAEFLEGQGKAWENAYAKFSDSGLTPGKIADAVEMSPEVSKFLKIDPTAKGPMGEVIDMARRIDDIPTLRRYLQDFIATGNKTGLRTDKQAAFMAESIRDNLDNTIMGYSPELSSLKKNWKDIQVLREMAARGKSSVEQLVSAGSATAPRQALMQAISGGGFGGVAGLSTLDPDDPDTWPEAIKKAVLLGTAGTVGGAALNKIAAGAGATVLGKAAGLARKAIPKVSPFLAKLERPATAVAKLAGSKQTDVGEMEAPDVAPTEAEAAIEGTPEGDAQAEKKAEYGQAYIDKLNNKMVQYWADNFSEEMEYPEYVAKVAEMTHDFDPSKTAGYFYSDPKERAKFIRDMNVAKRIKEANLEEAYSKPDLLSGIAEIESNKLARANLVDSISTLLAKDGEVATDTQRKRIAADVKAIMGIKGATPEEKQRLLFDKLSEVYGLGYEAIQELGLA